jgi:hypothetical protein
VVGTNNLFKKRVCLPSQKKKASPTSQNHKYKKSELDTISSFDALQFAYIKLCVFFYTNSKIVDCGYH